MFFSRIIPIQELIDDDLAFHIMFSEKFKLDELRKEVQNKDNTFAELSVEKEQLEDHINELECQLKQKMQSEDLEVNKNLQLKTRLAEQDISMSNIQIEKNNIEKSVMELERLVVEKNNDIEQYKTEKKELNDSLVQLDSLKTELSLKNEHIKSLRVEIDYLEPNKKEVDSLKSQIKDYDKQLMEATLEKDELENGIEELDNQHTEAMMQVIKIRDDLVRQLEDVKRQLADSRSEIKILKNTSSSNSTNDTSSELGDVRKQLKSKEDMVTGLKKTLQAMKSQIKGDEKNTSNELESIKKELETQSRLAKSLEEQVEDLEWQCGEKDRQLESLQHQLASLQDWQGDSTNNDVNVEELEQENMNLQAEICNLKESIADYSNLKEENFHLEKDLSKMQNSNDELSHFKIVNEKLNNEIEHLKSSGSNNFKDLCIKKDSEIQELKVKLETGAMALNDIHMDVKELKSQLNKSENNIQDKVDKIKLLRTTNSDLQVQLQDLQTKLDELNTNHNSLQNQTANLKETDQEIQRLMDDLDKSASEIIKLKSELKEISSQLLISNSAYEKVQEENRSLKNSQLELEQQIINTQDREKTHISQLHNDIKTMTVEKDLLEKEFVQSQYQLQAQLKNQENYINDLKKERESDSSAIEKSNQELLQTCHEKDIEITRLRGEVGQLTGDIDDIKCTLDKVERSNQEFAELGNIYTSEIQTLQSRLLDNEKHKQDYLLKLEDAEKCKIELTQSLKDLKTKLEEQEINLKDHSNLISELQACEQELSSTLEKNDELQATIDFLKTQQDSLQMQVTELKENNTSKSELVQSSEKGVAEELVEKETCFKISKLANTNNREKLIISDDDNFQSEKGRPGIVEQIERLQSVIKEKDQVIVELQTNNASLLNVMERGSNGDLENEVKALKLEKEQIMAIMTEKSRESSNLKSEVHRLMNVIAAEKGALEKLQLDNLEMKNSKREDSLDEMHKEAMQNLSRLVRDKDMEVEALKQKNETLLQVLQDSSPGGSEVSTLMQDKDNLMKQLTSQQNEREQMMTYLNQKHQESITYHNEIQRLNAFMKVESDKYTQMQCDYETLQPQFEDNKQALMKEQNELINYKQKYTELEVKHGELLQRSSSSDTIGMAAFNQKIEEMKVLQERHKETLDTIQEKEGKLQYLRQQSFEFEESILAKEQEVTVLKKQVDNVLFQLQGLQGRLDDVTEQKESIQKQLTEQMDNFQVMKDSHGQLTLTLQQREFELQSIQEKNETLTAIVHDQQQGAEQQEHVQRLMHENEATLTQARQLQRERDHAMLAVHQRQEEVEQLTKQVCIFAWFLCDAC